MSDTAVARNDAELIHIRATADSADDHSVLMLNLNRYYAHADFPNGTAYKRYRDCLATLLPEVGARILWQSHAHGQVVGEQAIDEILAVWYPSHQAFLDLRSAPGAEQNFALRAACVEYAVIHRCDGSTAPLAG